MSYDNGADGKTGGRDAPRESRNRDAELSATDHSFALPQYYDDGNPYAPPPPDDARPHWKPWNAAADGTEHFSLHVGTPRRFDRATVVHWNFILAGRFFRFVGLPLVLFGIAQVGTFALLNPALSFGRFFVIPCFLVTISLLIWWLWFHVRYCDLMGDDFVWEIAEALRHAEGRDDHVEDESTFNGQMMMRPRLRNFSGDDADDVGYWRWESKGVRFFGDYTTLYIPFHAIKRVNKGPTPAGGVGLHLVLRPDRCEKYTYVIIGFRHEKTLSGNQFLRNEYYERMYSSWGR